MKLRIGSRIQGGFAIVLLFLIASVAVAVVMLDQIDTGFHDLEDATERMALAGRLDAETASLRLRVNQYLVSREAEPLEQARQALERLNEDVAEAQAQAQGDEARAVFAGVEESLATYGEGLDRLETLTGERNGVVDGVLDRIGPEARKALTEIRTTALADDDAEAAAVAGGVSEQLMLARLMVNKFLVENRPADAEAARTQIQGAVDSLADLEQVVQNPRRRELINQLQELMPAYGQGIRDIEDIIAQRNAVRDGTLAREGEEILRAAQDLRRQAQEAQSVVNQTVNDSVDFGSTLTIVIGAAALVLGALFAVLIGRSITNPVTAMTEAMRRLAGGDKSLEIPARDRHDEVGDMAAAVQVFKENMIKADEMAEAQKVEQAAKEKRAQVVDRLIAHFNEEATEALSVVTSAATEMESTASSMSATAEETSQQAAVVASSAQEAAANVETVASAAEEMNSSVEEITRQVDQASKITRTAVSDAEQTNARVGGLADAVGQINDVVNLISDIAEQTNLLALNATIEAARAGDAGKGFAVVAGEVKNLANQTGKATEQISDQINAVQKATAEAVDSIRGITGTINQIAEISQAIASAVEEQGAATREIARNVQEAAAGTNEVSNSITHVNQAATDTGAATQQVLGAAGNLARQAETLREQVDTFLTNIRTA